MNLASLLYVPPPKAYPSAEAILINLKRYPAKHRLIVFSEHDYGWPDQIVLRVSPEGIKKQTNSEGKLNPWSLNNAVFLTALRIAVAQQLSHIIYLEADCRVGVHHWDDVIFNEYFNLGFPCVAAGTLATYNPCNWSREAAKRWEALVSSNQRKNVPIATYGWKGAADRHPCCVFPNGALSVISMDWAAVLFDLQNTVNAALNMGPWDMHLGIQVWKRFEVGSYDVMGMLTKIYSGYGDVLTTPEERLSWLRNGEYVAIHQCKSAEQP